MLSHEEAELREKEGKGSLPPSLLRHPGETVDPFGKQAPQSALTPSGGTGGAWPPENKAPSCPQSETRPEQGVCLCVRPVGQGLGGYGPRLLRAGSASGSGR